MPKLIKMLILTSRSLGLKHKVTPHRPLLRELEQQRCTSSQTLPEEHRMLLLLLLLLLLSRFSRVRLCDPIDGSLQRPQIVPSSSLTDFIQCLISWLNLVGRPGEGGMCVVLSWNFHSSGEQQERNRTELRANSPRPATVISPDTGVREIKASYYFKKGWKRLMSSF